MLSDGRPGTPTTSTDIRVPQKSIISGPDEYCLCSFGVAVTCASRAEAMSAFMVRVDHPDRIRAHVHGKGLPRSSDSCR